MNDLVSQKCIPCRSGDPSLTDSEIAELMPNIPEWNLGARDGIPQLQRIFKFKNYAQALDFTNKVAALAEAQHDAP